MMKRRIGTAVGAAALALSLASCSSGSSGSSSQPTFTLPKGFTTTTAVPVAVVKSWASKWCEAQPGISKEALIKIMGQPTSSYPGQNSWSAYEWQFNAFYDTDGNVRQLDINDLQLTSTEKAALRCDVTRVNQ